MNTDKGKFEGKRSEICDRVPKSYYAVDNELGAGFLESVFKRFMFDNEQKKIRVPPCESVVDFRGNER